MHPSIFRKKLNFPDLKRDVHAQWEKHRPRKLLIEDKASGTSLIQELQREGTHGLQTYKRAPGRDKQMRVHAQAIKFGSRNVYLPRQAEWLQEYVR